MTLTQKFLGDKPFFRNYLRVMLPIMAQNVITNFVNMLDNLMVGQLGEAELSGVSVANALIYIYNMAVFGAVSGAGILSAQFHGKKDPEGVRYCFRFKIMTVLILGITAVSVLLTAGDPLVSLYLKGEGDPALAAESLRYARQYIGICVIGLIPYGLTSSFSSTLRETDNAVPPLLASSAAMLLKLVLNYTFIFGHFGAPKLGVAGAAMTTVVSRAVELSIVAGWTFAHRKRVLFINGAFRSLYVPLRLVGTIVKRCLPLVLNESLWALGQAFMDQCYSTRGLMVVPAVSICNTFRTALDSFFVASGAATGIILGQTLGAGRIQKARENARRLITYSLFIGTLVGLMFVGVAYVAPPLYNTGDNVRQLARDMLLVIGATGPLLGVINASYYTVRAGGRAFLTMFIDSVMRWMGECAIAFVLSRFTGIGIIPLVACVQIGQVIKMIVGLVIVKSGIWARSIVAREETSSAA